MTGRLYSGAASLDLTAALLAIRDGLIPPTTNTSPDPRYGLDLVTAAPRPAPLRAALVLARGYNGFNSAMVVRATDPSSHGDSPGRAADQPSTSERKTS
jgi:minimal PKS chain-length factor (CLF/KS beta)